MARVVALWRVGAKRLRSFPPGLRACCLAYSAFQPMSDGQHVVENVRCLFFASSTQVVACFVLPVIVENGSDSVGNLPGEPPAMC